MISKCSYKLPKSKKHMERGEYVHCERRSIYKKNELSKKQFLLHKFKPFNAWL